MFRPLLALAVLGIAAVTPGPAAADPLDPWKWENRILLVFTPALGTPAHETQMRSVADHQAGYADRDMVVIEAPDDGPVLVDGDRSDLSGIRLRTRFDVGSDAFRAILVGKDGGAKLTREEPIDAETLFATIDAMPMRQREMREGG